MIITAFFQWWYGAGWAWQFNYAMSNPARISRSFDLAMLFRTLFAPWKRVSAATNQGSFVQQKMSQFTDALVSRLIGFMIRSSVIVVGLFALTVGSIFQLAVALVWPLLPVLPAVFLVLGVLL